MDGIIVGANRTQEWMLPWWWLHYRLHNSHPVAFLDFGMSEEAKEWCQERGRCIALEVSEDFIARKEEIDPFTALMWDGFYRGGNFWPARLGWFKKPLALRQTPFQRTLWIDLDCQIRADLSSLFATCQNPAGVALVRDREPDAINRDLDFGLIFPDETVYNSGVIVYDQESPIIAEFASRALTDNREFLGDQHLLSRILYEQQLPFTELPRRYNLWQWEKPREGTAIYHWVNTGGKEAVRKSLSALNPLFLNQLSLSTHAALDIYKTLHDHCRPK